MKRGLIFFLCALFLCLTLTGCTLFLSEEERQRYRDDYTLLLESLRAVGYVHDFGRLRERNTMEENLRVLWFDRAFHDFDDPRKNVELLILLGNFDFIAEGLRRSSNNDNPYFHDWPRDPQYITSSTSISFNNNEIFWLMLLLSDADFPEEHAGLKDVLLEAGAHVLMGSALSDSGTRMAVWFYYETHAPGLLAQINPDFSFHFSDEIKTAFLSADSNIQNRFLQAIDATQFQNISRINTPARVFSSDEALALMEAFPPTGAWEGGYIRIADFDHRRHDINTSSYGVFLYARLSDYLVPVIHPADARFAIFEEYSDGIFYASYTGDRDFDAYLLRLDIRIVDLLSGEEIFSESILSDPPPEEITWRRAYVGLVDLRVVDGKYFHNDFDFSRYAAVMEAHLQQNNRWTPRIEMP